MFQQMGWPEKGKIRKDCVRCLGVSNRITIASSRRRLLLVVAPAVTGARLYPRQLRSWLPVCRKLTNFACGDPCRIGNRNAYHLAVAAIALFLSGCGDDGIISRFMLKPHHIIVE